MNSFFSILLAFLWSVEHVSVHFFCLRQGASKMLWREAFRCSFKEKINNHFDKSTWMWMTCGWADEMRILCLFLFWEILSGGVCLQNFSTTQSANQTISISLYSRFLASDSFVVKLFRFLSLFYKAFSFVLFVCARRRFNSFDLFRSLFGP